MTAGPRPDAQEQQPQDRGVDSPDVFPDPNAGAIIVVGAGTAGCVVARRLVERGYRVVLLEAGSTSPPSADPRLETLDHLAAHAVADRWWPGVRARRTDAGEWFDYRLGLGLGGSSAVNGAMAEMDLEDPVLGPSDEVRAAHDRLLVVREPAAVHETGVLGRLLLDHAGGRPVSLARRRDRRQDAATIYLADVFDRLDLRGGARVDRIEPAERGVIIVTDRSEQLPAAAVVLCAGAIHTPAILLRSGLGERVGEGLQDHPSVVLDVTLRRADETPPLVTAAVAERAGIQLLPLEHLGTPGDGRAAVLVALMDPDGAAGTVRLASGDATGAPRVEFRIDRSPSDLDRLADGVRWALDLLTGPHATDEVEDVRLAPPAPSDHPPIAQLDAADLRDWILRSPGAYFHAAASCAIGRSLDDDGRLRSGEPVYVADAAAFPRIPRTGTHLPTMLQAERLSHRWTRGKMPE